jgi:nitrate reductase NapA
MKLTRRDFIRSNAIAATAAAAGLQMPAAKVALAVLDDGIRAA